MTIETSWKRGKGFFKLFPSIIQLYNEVSASTWTSPTHSSGGSFYKLHPVIQLDIYKLFLRQLDRLSINTMYSMFLSKWQTISKAHFQDLNNYWYSAEESPWA